VIAGAAVSMARRSLSTAPAAITASGVYGDIRICAGIVGNAGCPIGDVIKEDLEACIETFVRSLCDFAAEMNDISVDDDRCERVSQSVGSGNACTTPV
jgi:hypothetical protein